MNGTIYILNFHGLGVPRDELASDETRYWISAAFFNEILDLVQNRNDVQITFDDSNESDYAVALSLLSARKRIAKFFVVTDRIGQKGYLTRNHLASLANAGMIIGNHGKRHRAWAALDAKCLIEELVESKDHLEQVLQRPVDEAACPFGSYNRYVLKMLRRAGYGRVYTSDRGPTHAEAWLQPRNTVVQNQSLNEIETMITHRPLGVYQLWRDIKLFVKRWR